MTAIPFVDLQAQHRALEPELSAAIAQVMTVPSKNLKRNSPDSSVPGMR